jgi:hemolysin III
MESVRAANPMIAHFKRLVTRVCTPDELDMIEHYQTRGERLADLWVHVVGLALAAVGGGVLATLAAVYGGLGTAAATAIYAVCLVAMLAASTFYNLTRPCAARPVLRRLDEAAIFLMIAGSYTPFTTTRFEGWWAIGFTALIWGLALTGVAVKMVAPRISDVFWSGVYIVFGWLVVVAMKPMVDTVHPLSLALLAAGGLIYTAGVFIFIRQGVKYRRAIWHGFVVAGAGVHWVAILVGVVLVPG